MILLKFNNLTYFEDKLSDTELKLNVKSLDYKLDQSYKEVDDQLVNFL